MFINYREPILIKNIFGYSSTSIEGQKYWGPLFFSRRHLKYIWKLPLQIIQYNNNWDLSPDSCVVLKENQNDKSLKKGLCIWHFKEKFKNILSGGISLS